jgi:hypothetical protein
VPGVLVTASERSSLGDLIRLLDYERVRIYRMGTAGWSRWMRTAVLRLSQNRAVALGNWVFLPDHCEADLPALAHELTHCAQFQAWGFWRYFGRGLQAQLRDLLHRKAGLGSSPYRYTLEPGKPFKAYGMEQQGQIVEDYFRGRADPQAIPSAWSIE